MEKNRKLIVLFLMVISLGVLTSCQLLGKKESKEIKNQTSTKVDKTVVKLEDVTYLKKLDSEIIHTPYQPSPINAQVEDYKIEKDLSNVEGVEFFGDFTDAQKKSLVDNGFLITRTPNREKMYIDDDDKEYVFDQIHQIYDDNEYKGIASFVTTDSMTHIYHIFYDYFLRDLEKNELYPKNKELTEKLLKSNIEIYDSLENERLKDLQGKNVAYIATAAKLLDVNTAKLPDEIQALVEGELKNIEGKVIAQSQINNKEVDYSQMTVRGHYTRSEELKKYFLNTMYFGQLSFDYKKDDRINEDGIIQSLLLTHSMYKDEYLINMWNNLVDPIDFLVETQDDVSPRDYAKILYSVYGKTPDLDKLDEKDKFDKTVELIGNLPKPKIASFKGISFRLLPQRAVIDNIWMQNVVDIQVPSKRPIYSGLDLMTAFGNEKAKEIQNANDYNKIWPLYQERTEENIQAVKSMEDSDWQKNLYRGWLWVLESYKNSFGQGYPIFMQNEAWQKKDLVSALGSYTELKHDTVLYGKDVMAEMGGGSPDIFPKGYVEPNIEVYEKLRWLLKYTEENLKAREMLSESQANSLERFSETIDFLIGLSKKELENVAFTEEEYKKLYYIGGQMEAIMLSFVESEGDILSGWYEIENSTDRRMPVIVDLMAVVDNVCQIEPGKYASIATGKPAEIFVIYPQEGKLYMGRGGVFTYYETLENERMTDEKWQKRLLEEDPKLPDWYSDIIFSEKSEFEGNTDIGW